MGSFQRKSSSTVHFTREQTLVRPSSMHYFVIGSIIRTTSGACSETVLLELGTRFTAIMGL